MDKSDDIVTSSSELAAFNDARERTPRRYGDEFVATVVNTATYLEAHPNLVDAVSASTRGE